MSILRLCVALGSLSGIGLGQSAVTITTSPRDTARPISALLDQIGKSAHLAVTYEDPRYSKRSDMDERPAKFTYSPEELRALEGAEVAISRMLRDYGASGGLTFTLEREGFRLHVIPSETFDATGRRVRQDSILSAIINIPPASRDGGQLLEAICAEVQKQTGYSIGIGPNVPGNSLYRYRTKEGISNETASSALEHLLDGFALPNSFVWDLYYDPEDKSYGLNVRYVGPAGLGRQDKWASPNIFVTPQSRAPAPAPPQPAQ